MNRIEFYNELILREHLRKIIGTVAKRIEKKAARGLLEGLVRKSTQINEEAKLRRLVRALILKEDAGAGQHDSTGVNYLDKMFKNTNLIDSIKTGYQALTTSPEQRESFRAHILNAVVNSLAPERAMGAKNAVDGQEAADGSDIGVQEDGLDELAEAISKLMEIEVNIGDAVDEPDENMMIDVDEPEEIEASEEEDFASGLDGSADYDKTGRNAALETFKTVEKHIKKYYGLLGHEEDRQKFYDYLITNLKLYFNTFEEAMMGDPAEPTTPEYEQEIDAQAEQGDGEADAIDVTEAPPEDDMGMEEPSEAGEMAFEEEPDDEELEF